jgi:ribosomal protein S21
MAVIVNDDMPIEQALKMLWREANREGIPDTLKEIRYYVPQTAKKHAVTKIYAKMKRRRRAASRRMRGKI